MKIIRLILVVVINFVKVVHNSSQSSNSNNFTIKQKQQFPIDYKTHNRKIHQTIIQQFHASNSHVGKEERFNLIDILPKN